MEVEQTIELVELYDRFAGQHATLNKNPKPPNQNELKLFYDPLMEKLDEILANFSVEDKFHLKFLAMKCSVIYEHAKLLFHANMLQTAEECLDKALSALEKYCQDCQITFLYLRLLNYQSYFLAKGGKFEESQKLLQESEMLHHKMEPTASQVMVYNTDDLFAKISPEFPFKSDRMKFEKLATSNLQMLAWIYNKTSEMDKFAEAHHLVLKRQMETNDAHAVTWAAKCGRLGTYFLSKGRFKDACHHFCAASHILDEYGQNLRLFVDSPSYKGEAEELQHAYADLAKHWVKYALHLFGVSKLIAAGGDPAAHAAKQMKRVMSYPLAIMNGEKIMETEDDDGVGHEGKICKEEDEEGTEEAFIIDGNGENLIFASMNLGSAEQHVMLKQVKTTEEARALFLFGHNWLNKLTDFYTLNDHPAEYVNAILDLSELYRYWAFYELDMETQYHVQKRRADTLETISSILKDQRPQCYLTVSTELLRELAEVQLELMALNLKKLYLSMGNSTGNTMQDHDAILDKIEAISAIHSRLKKFGDILVQSDKEEGSM